MPPEKISIIDALVDTGNAASRSEARRLMVLGGVKVNGKKVTNLGALVEFGDVVQCTKKPQ